MSYHEITMHEYGCDGCGEVERDEVEGLPEGWSDSEAGYHFCPECS